MRNRSSGASQAAARQGRWAALLLDQNGIIQNYSQRLLGLLGETIGRLKGQPVSRLLPGIPLRPETPGYNRAFAAFWKSHGSLRQRVIAQPDATRRNIETRLCPIASRDETQPPMILVGLRVPESLIDNCDDLELLENRAASSTKAVMITDCEGIIAYVNPAFEQLTGFSQAEVAGKPASLLKSGLHEYSFYTKLWETLCAGHEFQSVFANRRKNGEIFFEEKRIRPFVDRSGQTNYFVAISQPVDDFLQATLLRFERQANHDPLTGLPNRNLFLDRLHQHFSRAIRHGTRFAVAYIDLDEFKAINDSLGHAAGDFVLQVTARHIQGSLREEDTVGRLGGDEFGLIISNTEDESDVTRIIEKILAALAQGACYEGQILPISASIGVVIYPEGGIDADSMIRQADHLMYCCKLAGGNGFRLHSVHPDKILETISESPAPRIATPINPAIDKPGGSTTEAQRQKRPV